MQIIDQGKARKDDWRAVQHTPESPEDWCTRRHETLIHGHRWTSEPKHTDIPRPSTLIIYRFDPDHMSCGMGEEDEPCGFINIFPTMLAEESSSELRTPRVAALTVEEIEDFYMCLGRWKKETRILSSIQSKIFNEHYQRIMAMGKPVLPLIFAELQNSGGQWYWALQCITGHNPALGATNIPETKQAWLDYAVEHGYLPAND